MRRPSKPSMGHVWSPWDDAASMYHAAVIQATVAIEFDVEPYVDLSRSIYWGSVAALVCAMYSHATSIAFL